MIGSFVSFWRAEDQAEQLEVHVIRMDLHLDLSKRILSSAYQNRQTKESLMGILLHLSGLRNGSMAQRVL
jgi:hypothetical protein